MSRLDLAIEHFDIKDYVEREIGRIVSCNNNEIRTFCPFCPPHDPDRKAKFYISIDKKQVFCQRCEYGIGIALVQFMADLEGISRAQVIHNLLSSYRVTSSLDSALDDLFREEQKAIKPVIKQISLPPVYKLFSGKGGVFTKKAEKYLLGRGLTNDQISGCDFYLCVNGKYRNRLIVPVYYKGKLVSFVARDLTNRSDVKYMNASVDQSLFLFNIDKAVKNKDMVVLVEGIFDVLNLEKYGVNAVASFRKGISVTQAKLLQKFKEVIVMYDDDAVMYSYRAAAKIGEDTEVTVIEGYHDAGEASETAIIEAIKRAVPWNSPAGIIQLFQYQ